MTRQVVTDYFRGIHLSKGALGALVLICMLAAGLRLYGLDRRSLWSDEILQARCVTPDWNFLLTCARQFGDEHPMPYAITFLWYRLAGSAILPQPDWLLRLPSVFAGILCIPAAWRLGDELLRRRGAWLLALLWSVLPLAIDTSQQVRQYSWFLLFFLIATLLLVLALKRGRLVYWSLWGITAALTIFSSYTASLAFAGQGAFTLAWLALVRSKGDLAERYSPAKYLRGGLVGIAAGLLMAAFWYQDLITFGLMVYRRNIVHPFASLTPTYLAGLSTWFLWGRIAWWDIQYWSSSGEAVFVLSVFVLSGLVWLIYRERMTLLLVLSLFLSALVYLLLGRGFPATPRLLLYLLVPYSLILVAGMLAWIEWLARLVVKITTPLRANRALTGLGAILIVVALIPKLNDFYTEPYDDWRGAAAYIQAHAGPSDAVLVLGANAFIPRDALRYYLPTPPHALTITDLASLAQPQINQLESRQGQVWGVVWNDGSFKQEQLIRWSGTDFVVVPFGSFTLLAPSRVVSGSTLAPSAASLVVHFHELSAGVPDETIWGLLSNYEGGENLVRNPSFSFDNAGKLTGWDISGSSPVSQEQAGGSLLLTSETVSAGVNAVQKVPLKSDTLYLLRFECRNQLSEGTQRVYITFLEPNSELRAFPSGDGYVCSGGMDWHSGKILFRAPPSDQADPLATIWLRNFGVGNVYFRRVSLTPIPLAE